MYKLRFFSLSLILCLIIFSCNEKKMLVDRKLKNISTETFYGVDVRQENEALINTIIQDVSKAFKLGPINLSKEESEIRIYFISPFGEKFFQQKVIDGKTYIKLINCKTIKKGDSLFMKQDAYIEATKKSDYEYLNTESLPPFTTLINDSLAPGMTDIGITYLIQVNNKFGNKAILITNPFDVEGNDFVVKYSTDLLERINKDFNFHFYDSWDKIVDSAFIKYN